MTPNTASMTTVRLRRSGIALAFAASTLVPLSLAIGGSAALAATAPPGIHTNVVRPGIHTNILRPARMCTGECCRITQTCNSVQQASTTRDAETRRRITVA